MKNLCDLRLGIDFLIPKARSLKVQADGLHSSNERLWSLRDTVKRTKHKPQWEEYICKSHPRRRPRISVVVRKAPFLDPHSVIDRSLFKRQRKVTASESLGWGFSSSSMAGRVWKNTDCWASPSEFLNQPGP